MIIRDDKAVWIAVYVAECRRLARERLAKRNSKIFHRGENMKSEMQFFSVIELPCGGNPEIVPVRVEFSYEPPEPDCAGYLRIDDILLCNTDISLKELVNEKDMARLNRDMDEEAHSYAMMEKGR
jgi:hypothetical protein